MKQSYFNQKKIISAALPCVVVFAFLYTHVISVRAFVEPSSTPPSGNVGAPITTKSPSQTKEGALTVNTDGTSTEGLIVEQGDFEVRSGESSFANGTYSDPDSGKLYDAKFGGSNDGIAVRGQSYFDDSVTVNAHDSLQGLALKSSYGNGNLYFNPSGNFSINYIGNNASDISIQPDGDVIMGNVPGSGVGIGGGRIPGLALDVSGKIGADEYCNSTGGDCFTPAGIIAGGLTEINDLTDGKTSGTTSVFLGTLAGTADDSTGPRNTGVGVRALELNISGINNAAVGFEALRNNTGNHNSAFGKSALRSNTIGIENTALGYNTMFSNSTGDHNVAIGMFSLFGNVSGHENTAIGWNALYSSGGMGNTALGHAAGDTITSGSTNTVIGYRAEVLDGTLDNQLSIGNLIYGIGLDGTDAAISTGSIGIGDKSPDATLKLDVEGQIGATDYCDENGANCQTIVALGGQKQIDDLTDGKNDGSSVFLGSFAGANDDSTVNRNTGIGHSALQANTSGYDNVAVGYFALKNSTTGNLNTAIGRNALRGNVGGNQNTALGRFALAANMSGTANVAVGMGALDITTTGGENTAIGTGSLGSATGIRNTALGRNSGDEITTGDRNIVIGYEAGVPIVTADEQLSIGNLIYGIGLDGTSTTISTGSVGIGDVSPDTGTGGQLKLDVAGNVGAGLYCDEDGNSCIATSDVAAVTTNDVIAGSQIIGDIMYQWGTFSDDNDDSAQVEAFHTVFGAPAYIVTVTPQGLAAGFAGSVSSFTSNGFTFDRDDSASGANTWGYIAIGPKPLIAVVP